MRKSKDELPSLFSLLFKELNSWKGDEMKSKIIYYPKESIKMESNSNLFEVYKNESIEEVFFRAFMELNYVEKRNYEEKHIENILNTFPRYSLTRQVIIEVSNNTVGRNVVDWEIYGNEFERANRQMLIYQFFHQVNEDTQQLIFNFLPVYKSQDGFPLQIGMEKALIEQGIAGEMNEEQRIKKWEKREQLRNESIGFSAILDKRKEKKIESLRNEDENNHQQNTIELEYDRKIPIDVNTELRELDIEERYKRQNNMNKVYNELDTKSKKIEQNLTKFTQRIKLLHEQMNKEEQYLVVQKKNMDEAAEQVASLQAKELAVIKEQESIKKRLEVITKQSEEVVKASQGYHLELKNHHQNQLNTITDSMEALSCLEKAKNKMEEYHKEYKQILREVHQREENMSERIQVVETQVIEKFRHKLEISRTEKEQLEVSQRKQEFKVHDLEQKLAQVEKYLLDDIQVEKNAKRSGEYVRNRKIKIELEEYEKLYNKVKYLEHTWRVNQELVIRKEKLTITDSELRYEKEEIIHIKQTAKEVELFVIMDECRTINDRVTIRTWPFTRPKAILMTKDYDSLKEKSTYFDLIERENRSLERWFSESILNKNIKI